MNAQEKRGGLTIAAGLVLFLLLVFSTDPIPLIGTTQPMSAVLGTAILGVFGWYGTAPGSVDS